MLVSLFKKKNLVWKNIGKKNERKCDEVLKNFIPTYIKLFYSL